jgi:retinol dehydrogenase 14
LVWAEEEVALPRVRLHPKAREDLGRIERMRPMIWLAKKLIMITPEKAAQSIVQLAASAEVEGKTGLYFNQLKPKEPSKLALDDELAERLWAESARLVKL